MKFSFKNSQLEKFINYSKMTTKLMKLLCFCLSILMTTRHVSCQDDLAGSFFSGKFYDFLIRIPIIQWFSYKNIQFSLIKKENKNSQWVADFGYVCLHVTEYFCIFFGISEWEKNISADSVFFSVSYLL